MHIPAIIKSTLPSTKNARLSAGECTYVIWLDSTTASDDARARRAASTIPALGSTPKIFLKGVSSMVA